MKEGDLMKSV